ncbi:ABC transporter permease [Bosea sp. 2RAB26]|uniref:ABC transporter permease n=1 Tax=Bosea sp. 2RAB26 TaxID=3237476 RepID=UPI003F90C202
MGEKVHTVITPKSHSDSYWGDVWRHRELLAFLAWRDLVVRYRQTVVGIAWTVIKPLATVLVYTFIFGYIAQLPSSGIPYVLIVLTGLLPWQLCTLVLTVSSESLIANASLVSKVYFPRIIIPLSSVVVCVVDHLVAFVLIGVLLAWHGIAPGWQIVLLPFVTVLAVLTALGLGLMAAGLNAHFRDFRQLIPLVLQLGIFASPVGYATGILPQKWQYVYALNPAVGIIDAFRWCILGKPELIFAPSVLWSILFAIGTLIYGVRVFRRLEDTFADVM